MEDKIKFILKGLFEMNLKTKIMCCRINAGLSVEQLAEKLGVSCQTLCNWESGETVPDIDKLMLIAETFGVTTDWLLYDRAPQTQPLQTPTQDGGIENILDKIVSAVENLFKRHGWISGILVSLLGLYRVLTVLFAIITTASSVPSFAFSNGMSVGIYGLYVVQALIGVAIIIGGIVMTIKLKKWCKQNSQQ